MGSEIAQSNTAWLLEQAHTGVALAAISGNDNYSTVGSASGGGWGFNNGWDGGVGVGILGSGNTFAMALRLTQQLLPFPAAAAVTKLAFWAGGGSSGAAGAGAGGGSKNGLGALAVGDSRGHGGGGGGEAATGVACGRLGSARCEAAALRLWRFAAAQNNAEASLKVGDYAFFGRGDFSVGHRWRRQRKAQLLLEQQREQQQGSGAESSPGAASSTVASTSSTSPSASSLPSFLGSGAGGAAWWLAVAPAWLQGPLKRRFGADGDPAAAAKHYLAAAELKHAQVTHNLHVAY